MQEGEEAWKGRGGHGGGLLGAVQLVYGML